jgi:hypothetical protein
MQIHLTDRIRSIKAQCNAVFPKICFKKCSHFSPRGEKIQNIFWGRIPPDPPTGTYDTTPNFLSLTTMHLPSLHTQYSMVPFCRCPPPRQVLKKSLCVQIISLYGGSNHFAVWRVQIISLYHFAVDGPWVRVMVGQMLHCKVVTHNIYFLIMYG